MDLLKTLTVYDFGEVALRAAVLGSGLSLLFALMKRGRWSKVFLDVAILAVFISSALLLKALLTSDMRLIYVQSYTSKSLPLFYKFTAWWGGQAGSLLFWLFVLGVYALLSLQNDDHPILMAVFSSTMLFFLITTVYAANPFERTVDPAPDGRGLNPLLQNVWMAVHPPSLYLGYVGMTVPFAYAALGAFTEFTEGIVKKIRVWLLVAWSFLTLGIVLGGRWAYLELGWGGYWAWDPVENASLIPWLTSTAAVHTFHLLRRGSHRLWFYNLTVASFILSILGTFLTRSGIVESVHAFAFSDIGNYFIVFLVLAALFWITSWLYLVRYKGVGGGGVRFRPLTRGWFIDWGNYVWVVLTLIVLGGTFSPVITEVFTGTQIATRPDFFTYSTAPFWVLAVLFSALSLLSGWDKRVNPFNLKWLLTSVALSTPPLLFGGNLWASVALLLTLYPTLMLFERAFRLRWKVLRDPSLIAHLGLLITAVGIALSWNYRTPHEIAFKGQEEKGFYAFRLKHLGWQEYRGPNYEAVYSLLSVKLWRWDLGEVRTERRRYFASGEITTEAGIKPLPPIGDFYAVMQGAEDDGTFYYEVRFVPGVQLVWFGPMLVFLSGLTVALRSLRRRLSHQDL